MHLPDFFRAVLRPILTGDTAAQFERAVGAQATMAMLANSKRVNLWVIIAFHKYPLCVHPIIGVKPLAFAQN
jgi:hypothetical protein